MTIAEKIEQLIVNELHETDFFLVNKKVNQNGTSMKFFVDGLNGVGIKTCSRLSRKVSAMLDEEEPELSLRFEISSPGADNPLLDKRQYPQHLGRVLELSLIDEETQRGELKKVVESSIELEVKADKKKVELINVPFDSIKESKVKISFKRLKNELTTGRIILGI